MTVPNPIFKVIIRGRSWSIFQPMSSNKKKNNKKSKNQSPVCKFYGTPSGCSKGKNCTFLHVEKQKPTNEATKSKTTPKPTKQEKVEIKKKVIVKEEEEIIKFDSKSFQKLTENFEFWYIFTFLELEQILSLTRVSKLFYESLTTNDLWQDLGKLHYQEYFDKNAFENVKELMQNSSLYSMEYSSVLSTAIPVNIPFFNDKKIKKVSLNAATLYVLTTNGILYQTTHGQFLENDEKFFIKCCQKCGEIVDFHVLQKTYDYSPTYKGDIGILVNKKGEVYEVKSFKKSKVTKFDHSSFTENEHIIKVIAGHYNNLFLSKNGIGFEVRKNPFEVIRSNQKLKSISEYGFLDEDNNLRCGMNEEWLKTKDIVKSKVLSFEAHQNINGDVLILNDIISKGILDEIKDYYVGFNNVYFKTIKNEYFSTNGLKQPNFGRIFGVKKDYGLNIFPYFPDDEQPKIISLNMFNDFPMEIKEIYEVDYTCVIQGKKPFTKSFGKKLKEVNDGYFKEREEMISQILICKKCNSKYIESENKDDSCRFHLTNQMHEIKFFDSELDVYDCCNRFEPCQKNKHTQ